MTSLHPTKEFLTGGRFKAGFVHCFFKRCAFIDFINVLVGSSTGRFVDEAKEKKSPSLIQFSGGGEFHETKREGGF